MSSTDHLSKYQFLRHVVSFKKSPISDLGFHNYGTPEEEFSDNECAEGECNLARAAFQRYLHSKNADHGKAIGYTDNDGDEFEHYASEHMVGGVPHIVDFTYRQLDPKSKFPLVVPSSKYDEMMQEHRLEKSYEWDPKEEGEIK